jgi:hypothetical protein
MEYWSIGSQPITPSLHYSSPDEAYEAFSAVCYARGCALSYTAVNWSKFKWV